MSMRQTILWTVLPNGADSRSLRFSVVPSFRLQSSALQPKLGDFPEIQHWARRTPTFRVRFDGREPILARVTSGSPDADLYEGLLGPGTPVRSYQAQVMAGKTIVSYPAASIAGFFLDRYTKLALEYPNRLPPASLVLNNRYFGPLVHTNSSLVEQYEQIKNMLRQRQQTAADLMRRAFAQWMAGIPLPGSGSGSRTENPTSMPPGLQEHIAATNQENAQQAAAGMRDAFGGVFQDDRQPGAGDRDRNEPRGGVLPYKERPPEQTGTAPAELPLGIPYGQVPDPLKDFLAAGLFHYGLVQSATADGDEVRTILPVDEAPAIDFHQGLSLLTEYPELMRLLGLVYDIEIDLPNGLPPKGSVWLEVDWGPTTVPTANIFPRTRYQLNAAAGLFLASERPGNPEQIQGMVDLRTPEAYVLHQIDTDTASNSMVSYINHVREGFDAEEAVSIPPIKTDGLTLVRQYNDIRLMHSFVLTQLRQQQLDRDPSLLTFFAEDLVKGYRPDIWDERTGRWYSLTRRVGRYHFTQLGKERWLDDEGAVSLVATAPLDQSSNVLQLHEALCTWRGWGLCTPSPGPVFDEDGEPIDDFQEGTPTFLKLNVEFAEPPDNLPALRFGVTYRMRLRTVDLAGNSVPFKASASPEESMATGPFTYYRYDPITTPGVIMVGSGEGDQASVETVSRMVVRTYNVDEATAASMAAAGITAPPALSVRHVVPPPASLRSVESHAVFDTASGMDADRYADALAKALDPENSLPETLPDEPIMALPFLPDPLARDAVLAGLPNQPEEQEPLRVSFYDTQELTWEDLTPFRLALRPGTSAPTWNGGERVLNVYLPPGERREVQLASGLRKAGGVDDLRLMGLWQALADSLRDRPDELQRFEQMALNSEMWMLTPSRQLELIHATVRPISAPVIKEIGASRRAADTFARVRVRVELDARSTRRVTLFSTWEEQIDDPAADGPMESTSEGASYDQAVSDPGQNSLLFRVKETTFDTKYRRLTYYAAAATRYRQFFPELEKESLEIPEDPDGVLRWMQISEPVSVDVLSTAPPAAPRVHSIIPIFGWEEPVVTGSTTIALRRGGGLRVYLERPWFSSGDGELLGVLLWQGTGSLPASLSQLATQWATDPLWKSAPLAERPRQGQFQGAAASQVDLSLPEAPGEKFTVIGYPVHYDEARRLWFADIVLEPGDAYFPFIRLALCRYQPHSVAGAHLSGVVFTDYAQLLPERRITVDRLPAGDIAVTGGGQTPLAGWAGTNRMEVRIERRPVGASDLDWTAVGEPVALPFVKGVWSGQTRVAMESPYDYRLVVKEYEQFASDSGLVDRLVFAHVMALEP